MPKKVISDEMVRELEDKGLPVPDGGGIIPREVLEAMGGFEQHLDAAPFLNEFTWDEKLSLLEEGILNLCPELKDEIEVEKWEKSQSSK